MTLAVFDASEFQGVINWAAVVDPGIIRVHNSSRPDNYAQPNIIGARRSCPWRGWYQYLDAGADPTKAAHDFQATLGPTLPGEVMILDIEAGTGDQRARRQAWLDALQDPIEWTYSGLSFARTHLPGVRVDWIAAYQQSEPTDAHTLWQNTNARRFAGIANPCDGSLFNGTLTDLIALTQGAEDMDATQDARLKHVESMLTGLDFAINNGTPTPYSSRGEIVSRLRMIDQRTVAWPVPVTADAIATATAAKVLLVNADAIAAAVVALGIAPTKEEVAAAVYAALVANPLSLH